MSDGTIRYSHDVNGTAVHNTSKKPCMVGELRPCPLGRTAKNQRVCDKCRTTVTYSHGSGTDGWKAIAECPICWAEAEANA